MVLDNVPEWIEEQKAYYCARANEYDDWFIRHRSGAYRSFNPASPTTDFDDERAAVIEAFNSCDLSGDVLEFASGTGNWTARIAERASSVTAVDSSIEMMLINRAKLGKCESKVTHVIADIFTWQPENHYDAAVFAFWISHVPDSLLDDFIATVRASLKAGGSIFFVDDLRPQLSQGYVGPDGGPAAESAAETGAERAAEPGHSIVSNAGETTQRKLVDGTVFRIVKNYWTAATLQERFAAGGINITVTQTPTLFQYATGTRSSNL